MYNIAIIGIETCRKDALECYNPTRKTPNIDKFAQLSLVFDNYVTTAPNTYQSWGTFFSGKYAHNSGIAVTPKDKLKTKMMYEIFRDQGYHVRLEGFDTYQAMGPEINYPPLEDLVEPFFCFIANMGGHYYYGLTREQFLSASKQQLIDAHAQTIQEIDSRFFENVMKFKEFRNTIIILTADHGDRMIDGHASHHDNVDPQTTEIPLVVQIPGVKFRREVGKCATIDILPTLLGLCGIQTHEQFDGTDLSKFILSRKTFPERSIQIGPSIGCKEIRFHGTTRTPSDHTYSRREVLLRYKDYVNRDYVNNLIDVLERQSYFADEWADRALLFSNLAWVNNTILSSAIIKALSLFTGCTVLDAGAGTCAISAPILKSYNVKVVSIDQSWAMLKLCTNDSRVKKYVSDISDMMFIKDKSIDRVICRMVCHSEWDRLNTIFRELKRILKKGGVLVICEGVPLDDSIKDWYYSFLREKEKRSTFTGQDLLATLQLEEFSNCTLSHVVLKQQSILDWLKNSRVSDKVLEFIVNKHRDAPIHVKQLIKLTEQDNDVFCDWKFAIVRGVA